MNHQRENGPANIFYTYFISRAAVSKTMKKKKKPTGLSCNDVVVSLMKWRRGPLVQPGKDGPLSSILRQQQRTRKKLGLPTPPDSKKLCSVPFNCKNNG